MGALRGDAAETDPPSHVGRTLTGHSLADLRADRSPELTEAIRLVLRQVERPRVNLGGSGPPGRAD
ncbi:MAG TPA: hypothetical protein VFW27_32430 [Actinoplanes sp.]|jgi:hypothetical protein|nr:hypothetical protein [Actinoplanes sp.]